MNRRSWSLAAAVLTATAIGGTAGAQLPIQFDENTYPMNPQNTFGAFTFDAFSVPGALTDGPTSLILDIHVPIGGGGDVSGGFGVDFGELDGLSLTPMDFDASSAEWVFRLKILPGNVAAGIRTAYRDFDDPSQTTGEQHVFHFDLTGVPSDGNFHDLVKPLSDVFLTQGSSGLTPGDGLQNPGLSQVQIQSVFGSVERLNVEIDYVLIRPIPEPTTWLLVALGVTGMGVRLRCRRRSAPRAPGS
jgi:hypothetical protein